ncbi:MAG TPA: ABC transporter permease [Anaerolineaceae bacterium]|nr:ABC transporter permease [Anaerolineaceae bacterium]
MSVELRYSRSARSLKKSAWVNVGIRLSAIIMALLFTSVILLIAKANPLQAYKSILHGAFGSTIKLTSVIASWVPLVIATSGLLFTFTAGLWNIGMEGQIIMGSVFAVGAFRFLDDTSLAPALVITLAFVAGAVGGILWALLPGLMKIFGGVNEIFGGLGLNFVAKTVAIWLIFGPWKRPGVASGSGTEWIDIQYRLPYLPGTNLSLTILIIAVVIAIITAVMLKGTHFGLRLKAIGKNDKAAYILGVPTSRYFLLAFGICGFFAGIAGSILVTSKQYSLIPDAGFGYGFLGLLVAMLVNYHPIWSSVVALFFAALSIGNTELQYMGLNSYFAGVLQGFLVLFVVLVDGVRKQLVKTR